MKASIPIESLQGHSRLVSFTYTNWRGETGLRKVLPVMIMFGSTEFHPEPQWLLVAYDLNRQAQRTFAMSGIKDWCPTDGEVSST
jgi:predicted DNA-binding transcriptional regulator YafY